MLTEADTLSVRCGRNGQSKVFTLVCCACVVVVPVASMCVCECFDTRWQAKDISFRVEFVFVSLSSRVLCVVY